MINGGKQMENEKDLKPVKVDDLVISDEDMDEFNKNMKEIIVPAVKKTLLTYFKPENYTAPCLKRKSFAFTIYWAFMRDCLIVIENYFSCNIFCIKSSAISTKQQENQGE